MSLLDDFHKAEKALFDHVGFDPKLASLPIEDSAGLFWMVEGDMVFYADTIEEVVNKNGGCCEVQLTDFGFESNTYAGEQYTMLITLPDHCEQPFCSFFENTHKVEV